ncbi:hypothetical protein DESPIG_03027 [Desulfovibrio piger ATCC 29098]|uniref:Uncharacterized protein n=1 Tax=Desulfovibrio piger ATCC 29098 TaxID=411464 RepID=B6WY51_9BACT|nr:hypothetical protein DESPIG_03027 [Desulfovibrio piger ATCC 29098]
MFFAPAFTGLPLCGIDEGRRQARPSAVPFCMTLPPLCVALR